LRNPKDALEEGFRPPDFGGAHPSDPRLHLKIWAYYLRDRTLGGSVLQLTIVEGMDCLGDYFVGLEALLQKRHSAGVSKRPRIRKTPSRLRVA
jgi:hypothetical protein